MNRNYRRVSAMLLFVALAVMLVQCSADGQHLTVGKICQHSTECASGRCYRHRCFPVCVLNQDCNEGLLCLEVVDDDDVAARICKVRTDSDADADAALDALDVPDRSNLPDVPDTDLGDTPSDAADHSTVPDLNPQSEIDSPGDAWDADVPAAPDIALAANGRACLHDMACQSGNCRLAPDGQRFCVADGHPCAGLGGNGLMMGGATCYLGDRYQCTAVDLFAPQDCQQTCGSYPAVDQCVAGNCTPCPNSCDFDGECMAGHYCEGEGRCQHVLSVGAFCDRDAMCESAECRLSPDGARFCVPSGTRCTDLAGSPLAVGSGVCHQGDRYLCLAADSYAVQDCQRACGFYGTVDQCENGDCQACPQACNHDGDCTAGSYCNPFSRCSPAETIGAACDRDRMCLTAHCDNGYCCQSGTCCASPDDCPLSFWNAAVCTDHVGCQGSRRDAVCRDARCDTGDPIDDDRACDQGVLSQNCDPYPAVYCSGAEAQAAPVCGAACGSDDVCLQGFHCDGSCRPDLGDGFSCDEDSDCLSGHCQNNYCCLSGDCCNTAAACPPDYGQPPVCDNPATCQGHRGDPRCSSGRCGLQTGVPDDSACGADILANECGLYLPVRCTGQVNQAPPICPTSCSDDSACDPGAHCDGTCVVRGLDGGLCDEDSDCMSDHCQNGRCCLHGDCCNTNDDCPAGYGSAPVCDSPGTCQGTMGEAQCAEHICTTDGSIDNDAACNLLIEADACGFFPSVYCSGDLVQSPPACANHCTKDQDCDPTAYCNDSGTCQGDRPNGEICARAEMCQSGNCRLAPDAVRYCAAAGIKCADAGGSGVGVGGRICYLDGSYTCLSDDHFVFQSCECSLQGCDAVTQQCGTESALIGTPCDDGAGACEHAVCLPLTHPLPDGYDWSPLTSGPLSGSPTGCGSASLPCNNEAFAFRWPADSGQNRCYDDWHQITCPGIAGSASCPTTAYCGQDAQYGLDVSAPAWSNGRFVVSGPAGQQIVNDVWTGLFWQQTTQALAWQEAVNYCATLGSYGGRSGWHLPDGHELISLANYGRFAPASVFPDMTDVQFWTSATYAGSPLSAWIVHFWSGALRSATKAGTAYQVRCVSGAGSSGIAATRYFRSEPLPGDVLIFDSRTGLLWMQAFNANAGNWAAALQYCETLDYGQRDDWLLPGALDLRTLIDTSRFNPAVDPAVWPATPSQWFWSGTASGGVPGSARAVDFRDGRLDNTGVAPYAVRCVVLEP